MTPRQRIRFILLFALLYALWAAAFTAVADAAMGLRQHSLATPVDAAIPFVPELEFVYLLCYVIPAVPLVVISEPARLKRLILAFLLINGVAFPLFILFPVYCPRPAFHPDSLATLLLSWEHALDRPVNNFPSLHAAFAWLAFLGCRERGRGTAVALAAAASGISVATLFVKQHFVADVVAGTLLAFGAWELASRFPPLRSPGKGPGEGPAG